MGAFRAGVLLAACLSVQGQTQVDLKTQSKSVDFSGAAETVPFKTGTVLPAVCKVGDVFFNNAAPAGSNIYACTSINVWTLETGGGNGASLQTVSYSTTPAFSCASSSGGTVVTFEISTALTANITPTINGCTNGQIVNFRLQQDATGGRTVTWPGGWSTLPQPSPTPNAETTILAVWDGTTGKGIASVDSGPGVGVEQAAPSGNPPAASEFVWYDSTNHLETVKNSSGTVTHGVQTIDCSSGSQLVQKINADGSGTCAGTGGGSNTLYVATGQANVSTGAGDTVVFQTTAMPALAAGGCWEINGGFQSSVSAAITAVKLWIGTATLSGDSVSIAGNSTASMYFFHGLVCNRVSSQTAQDDAWELRYLNVNGGFSAYTAGTQTLSSSGTVLTVTVSGVNTIHPMSFQVTRVQ